MPPRCLWMWQLSAPAVKGGTQVFSSMRKRAGRSASQGASAPSREGSASLRPRRGASLPRRLTVVPPRWWAEVFCGVVNYGEEEAAVSADAASSCRRLPSSPRHLRQPAEAARPAGAACLRCCVLKGLDHLAALDLGVEAVFEGTAPGYKLERTAHVD